MAKGLCKCGNKLEGISRQCRDCHSLYMREWRKTHKMTEKQKKHDRARSYLNEYIKRGHVKRETCCVCGSGEKIEAHHEDYQKPLIVKWFCRKHHLSYHINLKKVSYGL